MRTRLQEQGRRLTTTVQRLSPDDLAWRPSRVSNSAGNLVMHICGNLCQRILTGLAGADDTRDRDAEFDGEGPWGPEALASLVRRTFTEVDDTLGALAPDRLGDPFTIRGQETTVMEMLIRAVAHTGEHVGQIIYIAKARLGEAFDTLSIPRPSAS